MDSHVFIAGSFFLTEIAIIWIWYKFVYRKKNISSRSFWDYFRMLIGYYVFMLKYRMHPSAKNSRMDDLFEQYSKLRYSLFKKYVFGVLEIIFLPIIVAFMNRNIHFSGAPFFIFIAGLGTFLDRLKKSRIELTSLLNESQVFLFKFNQKKAARGAFETTKREHKDTEKYEKKQNIILKTGIVMLIITCGSISMLLALKDTMDMFRSAMSGVFRIGDVFMSPPFIAMVLITLLLYGVLGLLDGEFVDEVKKRRSYRKRLKTSDEIRVWVNEENIEELKDWLDEVLHMCRMLHIKEIGIGIGDLHTKKVVCFVSEEQMPRIIIGREVFVKAQNYGSKAQFDIIKLLLAHELVHIHYRDPKWMKKVSGIALIYIVLTLFLAYCACKSLDTVIIEISAFLMLNGLVFYMICDERYWKQVLEFRADRIGMAVSNTSPAILEAALYCTAEEQSNDERNSDVGFIHGIYQKRIEQQVHPDVKRRVFEAERGKPWRLREYFRYYRLISWSVITGKGWKI